MMDNEGGPDICRYTLSGKNNKSLLGPNNKLQNWAIDLDLDLD